MDKKVKTTLLPTQKCSMCNTQIALKPANKTKYWIRNYCKKCLPIIQGKIGRDNRHGVIDPDGVSWENIEKMNKDEVFNRAKNWQTARGAIRKHAVKIYKISGKPAECSVCGYSYHVEICHIKDVSKFRKEAKVSEINNINNLVALCRNHHKEFDDGYIDITIT